MYITCSNIIKEIFKTRVYSVFRHQLDTLLQCSIREYYKFKRTIVKPEQIVFMTVFSLKYI